MTNNLLTSATRTLCCMRFRAFIILTMAASISCFLSSSTFVLVSFRSGSDSPFAATVWIFTLNNLDVNWSFTMKTWSGSESQITNVKLHLKFSFP